MACFLYDWPLRFKHPFPVHGFFADLAITINKSGECFALGSSKTGHLLVWEHTSESNILKQSITPRYYDDTVLLARLYSHHNGLR